VTVSIGVAAVPHSGHDTLLADADAAMYRAKAAGLGVSASRSQPPGRAGRRFRRRNRHDRPASTRAPAA